MSWGIRASGNLNIWLTNNGWFKEENGFSKLWK
jgi:hypothetical protein